MNNQGEKGMCRFERWPRTGEIRGWIALCLVGVVCWQGPVGVPSAEAGGPVFAQITGVPTNPGPSAGGGADPTFQRVAMGAACLAGIFFLSLLCYLVLFRMLLNSYWPRTAHAGVSAIFWILSTALILAMFWQSLKYRFTPGEAWYNENGVRALVILQGVVVASLFLFTRRSEGPFPTLVGQEPERAK